MPLLRSGADKAEGALGHSIHISTAHSQPLPGNLSGAHTPDPNLFELSTRARMQYAWRAAARIAGVVTCESTLRLTQSFRIPQHNYTHSAYPRNHPAQHMSTLSAARSCTRRRSVSCGSTALHRVPLPKHPNPDPMLVSS